MALSRRHLATAAFAAAAVAGVGWLSLAGGRSDAMAPAAEYVLLDGSKLEQQALKGQVTLVNFWATSCTTCVAEMPEIIRTYERHKARGMRTVAVAMSYDPPAYVASFTESRQLPFDVALDTSGQVARQFGDVRMTPTTFLIDKQGRIVKRYVGKPDFEALNGLVEKLLAA